MNSPHHLPRPLGFSLRPLLTRRKGHVFFLALLVVAAIPALLLTCVVFLPIQAVQWLKR